jgi:hypothetical protein
MLCVLAELTMCQMFRLWNVERKHQQACKSVTSVRTHDSTLQPPPGRLPRAGWTPGRSLCCCVSCVRLVGLPGTWGGGIGTWL